MADAGLADAGLADADPSGQSTRISQYWHPILGVEELIGGPVSATLLGQRLVAFLGPDGSPTVLKDLCVHRGTPLSMGTVRDGCVVCPYHGWTYDASGRCVNIPALGRDRPIPKAARTDRYRCEVRYGLLWVALEEPVFPLPRIPAGVGEDEAFTGKCWARLEWNTSAGRAVENAMDLAHFPFVHPYLLADPEAPEPLDYEVNSVPDGLWFQTKRYRYSAHGEPEAEGFARYHHTFPFTHHLELVEPGPDGSPRVTMLSAFHQPTEAKRTLMWWFLHRNFPAPPDEESQIAMFLKVLDQDRLIAEAVRPEAIPTSVRDELHLKVADAPSILYRRWLGTVDMMGLAQV